jgi:tRNA pseudouridine55 synthase
VDGFINFLKPPGMTSHDAVSFIRKQLSIKKVGHTGTLDPGVAGVLPICVGKATRLAEYIVNRPKSYRAEITLGITTDSQDAYGRILSEKDCSHVPVEEFQKTFNSFLGPIEQIPPMTSAVHIKGVRLYELARQGIEIERKPRKVTIYQANIIKIDWQLPFPKVIFDVCCSKGTYIRTLCHDIGEKLGVGAHLSFLIRTQTGSFKIEDAWTREELLSSLGLKKFNFLLPMQEGISFIPAITVNDKLSTDLCHGKSIILKPNKYHPQQVYQISDLDQRFIAIGQVFQEDEGTFRLKPVKVFG